MDDLINRQAAIDAIFSEPLYESGMKKRDADAVVPAIYEKIKLLPSAQQEPNYCRECKWSRCHIYAGKHGESETYWRCLNWDGETDEEGYCHEWERRTE